MSLMICLAFLKHNLFGKIAVVDFLPQTNKKSFGSDPNYVFHLSSTFTPFWLITTQLSHESKHTRWIHPDIAHPFGNFPVRQLSKGIGLGVRPKGVLKQLQRINTSGDRCFNTPQPPDSQRVKNNLKEIPWNFSNPKLPNMGIFHISFSSQH